MWLSLLCKSKRLYHRLHILDRRHTKNGSDIDKTFIFLRFFGKILQILYPDPIWCDHRLFFRAVHFDLQLSCMLEKTCDQTALRVCQL